MTSVLNWSPIHNALAQKATDGGEMLVVLSPFVTVPGIRHLHSILKQSKPMKVICRWRLDDLLSGAADLDVYTYLRDQGSELYINNALHAKLYVYSSNDAFLTSGNVTLAGLGVSKEPNLEVGTFVRLDVEDWNTLFDIFDASRRVDEGIYIRLQALASSRPKQAPIKVELLDDTVLGEKKRFTIASLPASTSPDQLIKYYFRTGDLPPEDVRRALHDLFIFKIQPGLPEKEFRRLLNEQFRRSPFVSAFVEFLRENSSLRFGAVKEWMHTICEDVPLPYRWELNENVRILYDWLAYFYPEISWDRPNFSQVIYWRS